MGGELRCEFSKGVFGLISTGLPQLFYTEMMTEMVGLIDLSKPALVFSFTGRRTYSITVLLGGGQTFPGNGDKIRQKYDTAFWNK